MGELDKKTGLAGIFSKLFGTSAQFKASANSGLDSPPESLQDLSLFSDFPHVSDEEMESVVEKLDVPSFIRNVEVHYLKQPHHTVEIMNGIMHAKNDDHKLALRETDLYLLTKYDRQGEWHGRVGVNSIAKKLSDIAYSRYNSDRDLPVIGGDKHPEEEVVLQQLQNLISKPRLVTAMIDYVKSVKVDTPKKHYNNIDTDHTYYANTVLQLIAAQPSMAVDRTIPDMMMKAGPSCNYRGVGETALAQNEALLGAFPDMMMKLLKNHNGLPSRSPDGGRATEGRIVYKFIALSEHLHKNPQVIDYLLDKRGDNSGHVYKDMLDNKPLIKNCPGILDRMVEHMADHHFYSRLEDVAKSPYASELSDKMLAKIVTTNWRTLEIIEDRIADGDTELAEKLARVQPHLPPKPDPYAHWIM